MCIRDSCYSYLPKVVVKAEDEREVRRLIRLCQQCGTPFTFRAAGSSLSGQCSSEDVLIVCNDGFKKMEVIDKEEPAARNVNGVPHCWHKRIRRLTSRSSSADVYKRQQMVLKHTSLIKHPNSVVSIVAVTMYSASM